MARVRQLHGCDHCARSGNLETVQVLPLRLDVEDVRVLALCAGCMSPSRTWRLRWRPVDELPA
jgi:hypothetical protein